VVRAAQFRGEPRARSLGGCATGAPDYVRTIGRTRVWNKRLDSASGGRILADSVEAERRSCPGRRAPARKSPYLQCPHLGHGHRGASTLTAVCRCACPWRKARAMESAWPRSPSVQDADRDSSFGGALVRRRNRGPKSAAPFGVCRMKGSPMSSSAAKLGKSVQKLQDPTNCFEGPLRAPPCVRGKRQVAFSPIETPIVLGLVA